MLLLRQALPISARIAALLTSLHVVAVREILQLLYLLLMLLLVIELDAATAAAVHGPAAQRSSAAAVSEFGSHW